MANKIMIITDQIRMKAGLNNSKTAVLMQFFNRQVCIFSVVHKKRRTGDHSPLSFSVKQFRSINAGEMWR